MPQIWCELEAAVTPRRAGSRALEHRHGIDPEPEPFQGVGAEHLEVTGLAEETERVERALSTRDLWSSWRWSRQIALSGV